MPRGGSLPGSSGRFAARAEKELRRELLISPLPELGLVAANGPADPEPELVVENGAVTRLDGRDAAEFDVIDRFLVAHGLDLDVAAEAMALTDVELARRLVDVDVTRAELVRLSRGLTPAKLARVVGMLDPVELMFALKKLRARRAPGNQAHVTNLKENPALLAADAAEAAARGFAEIETTVGVARYAPLNAIALLVGSQTGRPGVMTQCAVEERRNLELAIRGLVTYAETLSVYGTEAVFADGDDTPWSKAFLGAAYASRGVKVRFTSGTGSEALMGHAQGLSMLYLESRCLSVVRAAGSQGVQNGSISCVALVLSVAGRHARDPRRERARRVARPRGRDRKRRDRLPLGDPQDREADGPVPAGHGLRHLRLLGHASPRQHLRRRQLRLGRSRRVAHDPARLAGRRRDRAGRRGDGRRRARPRSPGGPGRVRRARLPSGDRRGGRSCGRPATTRATCRTATAPPTSRPPTRALERGVSGLDVALALDRHGFGDVAEAVFGMQRQRVAADYLQTSAVIDPAGLVHSAVNDPNLYLGPGTGYRLEGERWELLRALPHEVDAARLGTAGDGGRTGARRARRGGQG